MSMKRLLSTGLLLSLLSQRVAAEPSPATIELAVNGPQGALLIMDGQALGRLPLPVNPVVPAGPHRFRLELGRQNVESDTLTLPALGQAELNLTLARSTLVAVLRVTDGLLLNLQPATLPSELRDGITESVSTAARQRHSILLGSHKEDSLIHGQSAALRCLADGDCHESLLQDGQVSYVLSMSVERGADGSPASCVVHGALLDTRTRDLSARADEGCASSNNSALSAQAGALAAKLLQATLIRSRGAVSVTSTPAGAKVFVDGRWLGVTPFQQEVFAGPRVIEVLYDRYLTHKETVQVEPNQTAAVTARLQHIIVPRQYIAAAPHARPVWRIVTGSLLLSGGLLLVGFGISALRTNGQCKDGSMNADICTPYYETSAVGGGLVGTGAALAVAGTIVLAIPRGTKVR